MKTSTKLVFIALVIILTAAGCRGETGKQRMVVAHYMVGMSMYRDAGEVSVAGLKKDITDAHDQGVDAFQINIGGFSTASRNNVAMFFQAASECDFPFYLFLSADYNPRIADPMRYDEIFDFMSLYANHPNHLKVNGCPLFTTWLGSQEGAEYWKIIKQRLRDEHDIDIFYVPYYGIYFRENGGIGESVMENLLNEYEGVIDGFWNWGGRSIPLAAPGNNNTIPAHGEIISKALEKRNMPFMSPVLPAFWMTYKQPEIYSEYEGGRGMESQWMSVINSQKATKWVNLVTWNDTGEDSHWSPHPRPQFRNMDMIWPHAGHAELNKYYIKWWKTGQQPEIEEDKLFYFYRNQFHDAQALNPEDYNNGNFVVAKQLTDKIYVTTMLIAPATLTIHSGSRTTVYDVPAGIHHWDADMGVGIQRFTLVRDGNTIIDKTGEKTVEKTPQYKTWSIFSGFATGMP